MENPLEFNVLSAFPYEMDENFHRRTQNKIEAIFKIAIKRGQKCLIFQAFGIIVLKITI
jgi:hypothetical protein